MSDHTSEYTPHDVGTAIGQGYEAMFALAQQLDAEEIDVDTARWSVAMLRHWADVIEACPVEWGVTAPVTVDLSTIAVGLRQYADLVEYLMSACA